MVCRLADATRPFGFATSPPDALTGPVLLFPRTAQSSRTVRSRSADNSDCPEPGTNPSLTSAVVDLACRLRSPPASGLDRQPRTFAGPERPVPRESATTSISCCWVVIPHRARCHLYRHVRISPTRFGISARPHAASGAISLTRRGSPVVRLVDRLATAVSVIAVPGGADWKDESANRALGHRASAAEEWSERTCGAPGPSALSSRPGHSDATVCSRRLLGWPRSAQRPGSPVAPSAESPNIKCRKSSPVLDVHICNECVDLCNDIMDEGSQDSSPEGASVAHRYAEWKVLTPNDPTAVELWTLQRHLTQAARQLAKLERFSPERAVVAKGDGAWRELGPNTPAAHRASDPSAPADRDRKAAGRCGGCAGDLSGQRPPLTSSGSCTVCPVARRARRGLRASSSKSPGIFLLQHSPRAS